MPHLPIDHPFRPGYRFAACVAGIYVLAFGIIGVTQTTDTAFFGQTSLPWALGLRTNRAFAITSVAAGIVLVLATVVGHNIDVRVDIIGGTAFMVVGTLMLMLMSTNVNFFGFAIADSIASYLIGTVLLAAGLYGKTAQTSPRRPLPRLP